jgi:hypothetical protein
VSQQFDTPLTIPSELNRTSRGIPADCLVAQYDTQAVVYQ